MWRVSWQDYRGWRTSELLEPHPAVQFRDFSERAPAEAELRLRRAAGMTACLSPTPLPRVRKPRRAAALL